MSKMKKLFGFIVIILVVFVTNSAYARIVALTHGSGMAKGDVDPDSIVCDIPSPPVLILPWDLCEEALDLLDKSKDRGCDATALARQLAEKHPSTAPFDTMLVIYKGSKRGIKGRPERGIKRRPKRRVDLFKYHLLQTEKSAESAASVECNISKLDEERAKQSADWNSKYENLQIRTPPSIGKSSILFFASFYGNKNGRVKARDTGHALVVFGVDGYTKDFSTQVAKDGKGEVWVFAVKNEALAYKGTIRYSPIYGTTALFVKSESGGSKTIHVDKLISVFDTERAVDISRLNNLKSLKTKVSSGLDKTGLAVWELAGAFLLGACVMGVLTFYFIRRKNRSTSE